MKKAAPKKKPVAKKTVKKAAPKVVKPAVKKPVTIALPKPQAPVVKPEVKEEMKATVAEKPQWPVLKSGPHLEVQGTWEFSVKNPNIAALRFLKL
jgi:hypothetical protein